MHDKHFVRLDREARNSKEHLPMGHDKFKALIVFLRQNPTYGWCEDGLGTPNRAFTWSGFVVRTAFVEPNEVVIVSIEPA